MAYRVKGLDGELYDTTITDSAEGKQENKYVEDLKKQIYKDHVKDQYGFPITHPELPEDLFDKVKKKLAVNSKNSTVKSSVKQEKECTCPEWGKVYGRTWVTPEDNTNCPIHKEDSKECECGGNPSTASVSPIHLSWCRGKPLKETECTCYIPEGGSGQRDINCPVHGNDSKKHQHVVIRKGNGELVEPCSCGFIGDDSLFEEFDKIFTIDNEWQGSDKTFEDIKKFIKDNFVPKTRVEEKLEDYHRFKHKLLRNECTKNCDTREYNEWLIKLLKRET